MLKVFLLDPIREIFEGRHVCSLGPFGAALVGGGISAVGSILGGSKAADATENAARMSTEEQRRQFDIAREDIRPYREAGTESLSVLRSLLGLGGVAPDYSTFTQQPDYKFAQEQGEQAILRNLAATGDLRSGEAGKALTTFGQGLASQKFADYYNRLAGLAGVGATQTANLNALGANVAGNIGNTLMAAGGSRASSYLNTGNAVADFAGGAANNYIFSNYLKQIQSLAPSIPAAQAGNPGWGSGAFSYAPD